jgi:uncharacterized protein YfaS (alpha-2-macroglobulin family)
MYEQIPGLGSPGRAGVHARARRLVAGAATVALAVVVSLAVQATAHAAVALKTWSPQGEIQVIRQVRVTFDQPMVRFGDPRLPAPMDVACQPVAVQAGSSRWVDDRTWIWDFAHDLPPGTACQVAAKAGVKSVAGEELPAKSGFSFDTGGPAIVRATPWSDDEPVEEQQMFALLLNGAATTASIEQNAYCEISGIGERVPVKVIGGTTRDAIVKAAEAQKTQARLVVLQCARPAPPDSRLAIVWGRGIASASGTKIVTTVERRLEHRVRPPFTARFSCERENRNAPCLPILPLQLSFTSPVPRALAAKIVLRGPDGAHAPVFEERRGQAQEKRFALHGAGLTRLFALFRRNPGHVTEQPTDESVTGVQFAGPLPENADLRIELPRGFVDDSGRPLDNAASFPLATRTGRSPPLAKFPGGAAFGILELNAEPVLPLTVRHVEGDLQVGVASVAGAPVADLAVYGDLDIVAWMSRLRAIEVSHYRRGQPQDDPREQSLLDGEATARRVQLPKEMRNDPHPFEVVGIPLPTPGFHVVEVKSPRLGEALVASKAPMYVRTSVLVTNLGVHFKWGAVNSLVWVTTLDKAQPVADAAVNVDDCNGRTIWHGRTDAHGLALVSQALPQQNWNACQGAPEGASYFVTARKKDAQGRDDMAFVWSDWQQGIEPWRFQLRTWGEERVPSRALFHTVMDRTLLRAGQTVSFKHYGRRELLTGLALPDPDDLPTTMELIHQGSGQKFEQPVTWRNGRAAENAFQIPADAKLGVYDVQLTNGVHTWSTGSFRVEEFRLPAMTGRIVPPKGEQVQPKEMPVSVSVEFGNGGGAAGLPVRVSAQVQGSSLEQVLPVRRYPGFSFQPPRVPNQGEARSFFREEYVDEDDESEAIHPRGDGSAHLVADKRPIVLDREGAGHLVLDRLPAVTQPSDLLVQAEYADPNGEIQTLSQTVPLWPSSVVLAVRADDWVSVGKKLATQVLALDTSGKPKAGVDVKLHAIAHRDLSSRKRLVGGFYTYDNRNVDQDLGEVCSGRSDARGLVFCEVTLEQAGNVELVASAADAGGHVARAASSVWITGQDEIWFSSQNDDRMDLLPEQRAYEPGETARFQVRSPFRHATVLIAVERNGIIETHTQEVSGRDPTVELKIRPEWAPNVFVSVLAVRGRVRDVPWYSFFTWGWHAPVDWWHAWREEGPEYQAPTALVDLAKPAFRLGITEIEVGRAAHELKVDVTPDKPTYPVRATSRVKVHVTLPDGRPAPAGSEVAVAAVDEALLSLMPNDSWNLIDAMIRQRGYGVETSTAQMQIIGKRHFGKKAAAPGGGGGQFPTRELFDTLLTWNPRVVLDAHGDAVVSVPLNDSLTSFRIVAVADVVQGPQAALFGTGYATIRATQDLQVVSGVPPLVREGDRYRAMFTLRNTTAQAVQADVTARVGDQALPPAKARIDANGSAEISWDVTVPFNVHQLTWSVAADAGAAHDRMKFDQKVAEAVPVTVQQATLQQLDKPLRMPIAPPVNALADGKGVLRGGIEVGLKPRLGDGLPGVRDYFLRYPYSCLEQQASVAIGLRDPVRWKSVAARMPLYLDEDGLANYFPPAFPRTGSDSLTAYLLSISDEASKLGEDYAIPDDVRTTMESGLIAFVEGRVTRDFWRPAFLRNGDLDVRKLAALEALSRHGKVQPRMLDSIQVLPNQWPTGAVIDWLQILERVPEIPDRAAKLEQAEQILRSRLNVQGTRLGFSTERDDSWWWLMSNGDVNSVRMILAVLDRPGWKEDLPRIVTGTLQRQQEGRWSTTVSNTWGTVAMAAFSKRFEKEPVTGATRAGFEGAASTSLDWAKQPAGGTLALGWPAGFGTGGSKADATLVATQQGSGRPWVTVTSKAAVPVVQPFSSGYRITKTLTPVEPKAAGRSTRGDVVRVTLKIDVQADATWVVVSDPIPAGATILGNGLGRDDTAATASENEDERGWLAYQERTFEAFRAYYRYLPKGSFQVEYTMRLNNAGTFGLPATHVEAMYAPEMFGEWPNATWTIQP